MKVEISPPTREKFEELYQRRGLTQTEAATRVYAWFVAQDELVQQAIFKQLPARLAQEARRMLIDGIIPLDLEPASPSKEKRLAVGNQTMVEARAKRDRSAKSAG